MIIRPKSNCIIIKTFWKWLILGHSRYWIALGFLVSLIFGHTIVVGITWFCITWFLAIVGTDLRWVFTLGQFLNRPIWARVFSAGLKNLGNFKLFEKNFERIFRDENFFQKPWNLKGSWDQPKKPGLIWGGSETDPSPEAQKPNVTIFLSIFFVLKMLFQVLFCSR